MVNEELLAVWFTPDAIRDVFDGYDDNDPRKVFVEAASDERLEEIGQSCLGSDALWRMFRELLEEAVEQEL